MSPPAPGQAPIEAHGLIGDRRTCALVDDGGRIDWLCWPRFDSPPLFRRLIDEAGGCWQLAPAGPHAARSEYARDANVLRTVVTTPEGSAAVHEFMVVPADAVRGSQLVRLVEGLSGTVELRMALDADDGFARAASARPRAGGVALAGAGGASVHLTGSVALELSPAGARASLTVCAGEHEAFVLSEEPLGIEPVGHSLGALARTLSWWRDWIGSCRLPAVRRSAVARSALTLKMLEHEPSSALVAAPTTSLPEQPGGTRNWDYRYTWLRDSSLMVLALQELGHHDESMAYWEWLGTVAGRHGADLAVAYSLDGFPIPEEQRLDFLSGHAGSRPVRTGNAAASQRQHDVFGHVLGAAAHCYFDMDMELAEPAGALRMLADLAAERWSRPDDSIWEVRDGRAHHTYSELMCWYALDRAVALADAGALDGDRQRWADEARAIRRDVEDNAFDHGIGAFAATIGGSDLDASLLVMPLIGFLPPDDPRVRATRSRITERLGQSGLLRRYRCADGLQGGEGAFLLCTTWLAESHAADGDFDTALELLDRVLATGNDLGLLGEEADPGTGRPLGNFPQGLTHLGVIRCAMRLDRVRATG